MKTTTISRVAAVLLPLALCACGGKPGPNQDAVEDTGVSDEAPKPRKEHYVGPYEKVDASEIVFDDEAIGARFAKLGACFAADANDDKWIHFPLRKIGNFIQEDWCTGNGKVRSCAGGSFRDRPGDRWRSLHTLHYDSSWPKVFGLGAVAGDLPPDGSWGVRFSYNKKGARITGEGLHVTFIRYEGRESAGLVYMGDIYSYKVEQTDITIVSPLGNDGELAALIASPESLKSTAVARLDALEEKVRNTITAGEARKCVYGPYKGDGIPPSAPSPPSPTKRRPSSSESQKPT